jgi:hypothetical protein
MLSLSKARDGGYYVQFYAGDRIAGNITVFAGNLKDCLRYMEDAIERIVDPTKVKIND